ncbi:RNA-binding S4 domain-containing protein [Citricoccus sp. SGAir0253]|uniref:RNA-binding S4 domain-containing protein n=1 Tax=Citricoccus sp. SGAir0253 TaxID=2567881 RepID=UPI0010CD031A|nr:RNA-binding S4 domain-containing protein [Citricoccus sp. SGAir0253]QCU78575.1 RNA-binding S4 domain-containing protein [Citricoccus sp. SGAir0253]
MPSRPERHAPQSPSSHPVPLEIRDDVIRLGQALKLANLVEDGADARVVIEAGLVQVNGDPETRRGRQLHHGDVIEFSGEAVKVVPAGH